MPLFVIIGYDVADSHHKRQATRPEHIKRLKQLQQENRLIIAGPTPISHDDTNMSGSVIIAKFASMAEAQSWVNDEPYLQEGVYSHVDIRPFIQALPAVATQ